MRRQTERRLKRPSTLARSLVRETIGGPSTTPACLPLPPISHSKTGSWRERDEEEEDDEKKDEKGILVSSQLPVNGRRFLTGRGIVSRRKNEIRLSLDRSETYDACFALPSFQSTFSSRRRSWECNRELIQVTGVITDRQSQFGNDST